MRLDPEGFPVEPVKEPPQPVVKYTTGEWLRTWFEVYSKPNLREATQDQYTNFLKKHLNPNIGDIPLEQLTSLRIQKMYQDLRTSGCIAQNKRAGTGLSQKTVRNIHMMLHVALDQAVKEGLLNKNPTDGCIPPKVEKKEMKVIQPEQIGAYLRAAEEHNVLPMFYLELTSGLRRGELLARCFMVQAEIAVHKRRTQRRGRRKSRLCRLVRSLFPVSVFCSPPLSVSRLFRRPGASRTTR